MKNLRSLILLGIAILLSWNGFAQKKEQPFRVEMQAPEDSYPYEVINLGAKGLIVYFEDQVVSKSQASWKFVHYDAYFKKKWSLSVQLNRFLEPQIDFSDSLMVAVLFKYDGKRKSTQNHQLVSIRLKDTVKTVTTLPLEEKLIPNVLHAQADRAFMSYYDGDKEQFYMVTYADQQLRKIDFPKMGKGYVQFVNTIPNSSQLLVGLRVDESKRDNRLVLYRISIDGIIVTEVNIPTNDAVFFNQCKLVQLSNDTSMLLGTYVLKNNMPSGIFTPANEVNTGIFTAIITNCQKSDSLNLYNFAKNKMIFKYLPSREMERMKKKLEPESFNSNPVSLNLQLMNHQPVKVDSVVIFMSEAYYPEYRTEEQVNYDFYGRPFPNNRTYFEGYRYTNALICGFDLQGKMRWDNNFSLSEMISYELKPRVAFCVDSSNVLMAYSYEGNIVTMAINGCTAIQNAERTRIEPLLPADIVVKTEKPQIQYWYKNYFLSFGYQKIRNSNRSAKDRDNAFFLNKMIYRSVD